MNVLLLASHRCRTRHTGDDAGTDHRNGGEESDGTHLDLGVTDVSIIVLAKWNKLVDRGPSKYTRLVL